MNTSSQSSVALPINEQIQSIKKGVPKDHHYANTEGYLLQFYHLFPRLTKRPDNGKMQGVSNDELIFIIHLSRFDFEDTQSAKPSLATIAENIGVSLRTIHNYKQSCIDAGLLIVESHSEEGLPSDYDFSPLYMFCYEMAEQDGWLYRKTLKPTKQKKGGVCKPLHRGYAEPFIGGMQTSAHEYLEVKSEVKTEESFPDANASGAENSQLSETTSHSETSKSIKRTSEAYRTLEAAVKLLVYGGVKLDMQAGHIIRYLLVSGYTPQDVAKFVAWYKVKNQNASVPRQIAKTKGKEDYTGKFVTWWETWRKETAPKPMPEPTRTHETPLSEEERRAMIAMLGGAQ